MKTVFTLSATGWSDEDIPLHHTFSVVVDSKEMKLKVESKENKIAKMLPGRFEDGKSEINIFLYVVDELGATANASASVELTMNKSSFISNFALMNEALDEITDSDQKLLLIQSYASYQSFRKNNCTDCSEKSDNDELKQAQELALSYLEKEFSAPYRSPSQDLLLANIFLDIAPTLQLDSLDTLKRVSNFTVLSINTLPWGNMKINEVEQTVGEMLAIGSSCFEAILQMNQEIEDRKMCDNLLASSLIPAQTSILPSEKPLEIQTELVNASLSTLDLSNFSNARVNSVSSIPFNGPPQLEDQKNPELRSYENSKSISL
jgi:hypothetical protein